MHIEPRQMVQFFGGGDSVSSHKVRYLYVTGVSYCGSTLFALLLNAHPEIVSIGEAGGPNRADKASYPCSCGVALSDCMFFRNIVERVRAAGGSFDIQTWRTRFHISKSRPLDIALVRPLRNVPLENLRDLIVRWLPGYTSAINPIKECNLALARAALDATGKTVFADTQKDSIRIKFLREIDALDLRVIHLLRDVRAGTASILKNTNLRDPGLAAQRWVTSNMNAERAKRYVTPDRWLTVRYDDLCANTQHAMDQVSDFLRLDRAPVPSDLFASEHHVIGNRMRLGKTGTVRQDDSWQQRLSSSDLNVIARVAGTANHFFGFKWP